MSSPDSDSRDVDPAPPPEPEAQVPPFEPDYNLVETFKKSDDRSGVEYR